MKMYIKVMLYLSFLTIHNVLCYQYMPRKPYENWSKLSYINYWRNNIKLEHLYSLNDSTIDELQLPLGAFYLKIDKSSISTLQPNIFNKCMWMYGVFLSNVELTTILPGAFNGTSALQEIDLSKNKLTQIVNGVFSVIEKLRYLDLSYNSIRNISDQSFSGLQQLLYLYLQGNEISLLHHDLFESQVDCLLELDVSSNRLTDIEVTFSRLSRLTDLLLQTNNISDVSADLFENLTSLQYLDISNNSIQHIIIPGMEKLTNISLQNNKISVLNDNLIVTHQNYVESLNISSNSLKEISIMFRGMSSLSHLYLQANNISSLASNSFQNVSALEHLDLSDNCIRDIPENIFSGSERITNLYLHNNKIMFLDSNTFASQKRSLITLKLSSNALREISTVFRELSHLTNLYLQENEISSTASGSFQGLMSLEYLDICHNKLERFQYGLMDHLDRLKYLNFSNNKFEEFPLVYLSYLTDLRELIFDNNKIKYLNGTQILEQFPILRKIGLRGNLEWACPRLLTFVKQMRIHNVDVLVGNNFTGQNVRGIACYEDDSVSSDGYSKSDTQDKDINTKELKNESNPKYTEKDLKDLINMVLEKQGNGNVFVTILITIITVTLIVLTFLQFFFLIKLKRNTHEEQLELL